MQDQSSHALDAGSSKVAVRLGAADIAHQLGGKAQNGYWMARCPCHDDKDPSLQIWDGDNGPAFKCYAGCADHDIRAAVLPTIHLSNTDLYKKEKRKGDPGHLDSLDRKVVERLFHIYTDEDEKPVARVERIKYASGKKTFRQQRPTANGGWLNGLGGIKPPIYNLPKIKAAIAADKLIYIVEGEKICDELGHLDIPATTNPMGAGKWRQHHTDVLKGAQVVILPDNDEPGHAHAQQVADALDDTAKSIRLLELPDLPPKGDAIDWLSAGNTKEELVRLADSASLYNKVGDEWELPIPFSEPDLPTFPTEALPPWLREWVKEEAEATQTPVDLAAMIGLSVVAAACQRKVRIRLWEGYEEPVNIYSAIVLPPGSRKSAVMADATRVVRKYEREQADKMKDEVAQAESRLRRLEKKLRIAEDQAAKGDDSGGEADRLSMEVAEAKANCPVLPRIVADDVTPEKVVQLMGEQGGKLAVFSPEGGIFETMAGRYSGSIPNFDAFLKAHTGEDIITDRLTRSGNHVVAAALTMCLAIQPDVIRSMAGKNGFRGRGLTARFLYAIPTNLMGRRKVRTGTVSDFTRLDYEQHVRKLLEFEVQSNDGPMLLTLSDEAREAFIAFAEWLEPQLAPNGELGFMADWGGKLAGVVARIAALVHMAEYAGAADTAWKEPVESESIQAAVRIGQFLLPNALAAYVEMGSDQRMDDARYLWEWIATTDKATLKKQEIWQGTKSRFREAAVLNDALRFLCERGFVRVHEPEEQKKRGRPPAPTYEVNPLANIDF